MKKRKIISLITGLFLTTLLISCGKSENITVTTNNSKETEQSTLPSIEVTPVQPETSTSDTTLNETHEKVTIVEDTAIPVNDNIKATYSEELARFRYQGSYKYYYGPNDHYEILSCTKEYIENGNLITCYERSNHVLEEEGILPKLYHTVTETSIIESSSSYSLVENKEILRLPLKVNNKWTQFVTINNVEYAMDHEITKIENENGLRVITVESKIENIPDFPDNTYRETATYKETLGLTHVDASRRDVGSIYLHRAYFENY